jgi:hypothetical protein
MALAVNCKYTVLEVVTARTACCLNYTKLLLYTGMSMRHLTVSGTPASDTAVHYGVSHRGGVCLVD